MDIKNWKEELQELLMDGMNGEVIPFVDQLLQESIREELDKIYGQVDSDRSRFVIDIARKKYSPQEDKQ